MKMQGYNIKNALLMLLFIFSFQFARADTYILKSGNRVVGKLVKETSTHYIISTQDLGELSVAKTAVDRIAKEQTQEEKLKALRSVPLDNLIEALITGYKGKPVSKINPVIAIMPFQVEDGLLREEKIGFGIAELLTDKFVEKRTGLFQIVERSRLAQTLSEQKLSLTGLISEDSAVKTGKLLGADMLLVGSISALAGNYNINTRLVNVETGQVLAAEAVKSSKDDINKEAISYIDLPEDFSIYFGIKSVNTPRTPWSVIAGADMLGNPLLNKNNTDLTSTMFVIMGLRYFPVPSVMFEFQAMPNPISQNSYSYNRYLNGKFYDRQTVGFMGNMSFSANFVQKFEPLFIYIGGGISGITVGNLDTTGREDYSSSYLPSARVGMEWRFKKRVGVNIFADILLSGAKGVTAKLDNGNTYLLYDISPLAVSAFIVYYF